MRFLPCLCLTLSMLTAIPVTGDEVRVLIDVSGSMKHNDPRNLRIPALKLLLELLPPGTQAGVWLFANDPETLIAPTKVDEAWKRNAAKAAEKIHSNGRLTDIEKAIGTAISGWEQTETKAGRHLILLTDGMVDVNGGAPLDRMSRKSILDKLAPRLQTLGIHVYTIALSDQADHLLLKQLAVATDGKNKIARTAEALQRTFLNIFKSAVPRDTVPLQENRFKIDSSIDEFSLLVFRRPDSPGTKLIKPSGEIWSADKYPENVRWHQEESYDLVTVSHPMPGNWRLEAETDPDNQVMIVTDLKLQVTPLPNYIMGDETVTLTAELTEHGERITRENFLRLMTFRLKQDAADGIVLPQDPKQPGTFRRAIGKFTSPGEHTLELTVDGKTFQRTWEQNIEVISTPVEIGLEHPAERPGQILLSLTPDTRVIDPKTFQARAVMTGQGETLEKEFSTTDRKRWRLLLDAPPSGTELTVSFQLEARDLDGNPLALVMKPKIIPGQAKAEQENQEEEAAASEEEDSEEEDEALLLEEELEQEEGWLRPALIATGVNLAFLGGGFFAWRWLRKKIQHQNQVLLSRLGGETPT